jgi:phosphomannomutase / phosphoglucomutase
MGDSFLKEGWFGRLQAQGEFYMVSINPSMFREYDIRGREIETELSITSIAHIAKAYGTWLRQKDISVAVVGHDNRQSSESFYRAVIQALQEVGVNVVGIGMCLTPQLYWAQHYLQVQGGAMITASHNPAGWNGLKLARGLSHTLLTDELQEVLAIAQSGSLIEGAGTLVEQNIADVYLKDIVSRVVLARPLKVVVNTANETSSFFSPAIFRALGCEVVEHNTNPDSSYPNYVPNPANVAMMEDTGKVVTQVGADIGLAMDADGDRLGITDEQGNIIWPDRWFSLLARQQLRKHVGASIVFDVKCTEALVEDIVANGGVPVMWKTGHAYIEAKMQEVHAPIGGEESGHVYFADGYYGFDDAHFAALKLLEYISEHQLTLSQIMQSVPKYITTPAMHAEVDDARKYKIVEALTQEFKHEGFRVVDINGARVYMHDGWGLVRATSNLPAIVLRFEAKTQEGLKQIQEYFRKKLAAYPEVSTHWVSA